jgi:hypothetical protein
MATINLTPVVDEFDEGVIFYGGLAIVIAAIYAALHFHVVAFN